MHHSAGWIAFGRFLASVCATWRRLILDDSSFWNTLYVSGLAALGTLQTFLPYSRTALVELGVDLFRVHPDSEPTRRQLNEIMETINRQIFRVRILTVVLHADSYDSVLGRLRDSTNALRELSITIVDSNDDVATQRALQLPLPQLRKLTVAGIQHPGFSWALVPSLRILDFHGWKLHPSGLHHIFECCPCIEELYIRDFCVMALPGDADNTELIAARRLRVLRLYRVNRDIPHSRLVVTPQALSLLPLHRVTAVSLEAMVGDNVLAEVRACFRSLGAVHSLEFAHSRVNMDCIAAHIRATTSSGLERSCDLFAADKADMDPAIFVSAARALGTPAGTRTIRHLVLPIEWVPAFLRNTDFTLRELETLKLMLHGESWFPTSMEWEHLPEQPHSCPHLRQVILEVEDAGTEDGCVDRGLYRAFYRALSSLVALSYPAPLSATLVLSRSFLGDGSVLRDLKSRFEGFAVL